METEHWESKHPTPSVQRVPIWQKIAYGSGGLTDFLYINFVNAMAVPIFAIALKMDPFLVAIAMAIPKDCRGLHGPVGRYLVRQLPLILGPATPFHPRGRPHWRHPSSLHLDAAVLLPNRDVFVAGRPAHRLCRRLLRLLHPLRRPRLPAHDRLRRTHPGSGLARIHSPPPPPPGHRNLRSGLVLLVLPPSDLWQ